MPYRPGFSEEDYERLKEALLPFRGHTFSASQFLRHAFEAQPTLNPADVGQILSDLTDLGLLQALGGNPLRWHYPDTEAF